VKLAWAVSGRGMAARAAMEAHLAGLLESRLDAVIVDRVGATDSMIEYCKRRDIEVSIFSPSRLEAGLLDLQKRNGFDCMGLTFNRILPASVINSFQGRIFNLHLSLLPALPGFGATRKALASGLQFTGVTVHFIDPGIDTGPIISQARVPIEPSDDEASLGRRQFDAALPLVLQTVRMLERTPDRQFTLPDQDLADFAAVYCRSITAGK
jgi:phosphoribosylglycinamide formyltransferase-1